MTDMPQPVMSVTAGVFIPSWVKDAIRDHSEGILADREREAEAYRVREDARKAALAAAYAVAVPLLDAATDPAWRAVLDLHRRDAAWEGSEHFYCEACPGGCCDSVYWPCPTVRLAAEHLGIELPDDPWGDGMPRPKDGSLDPKGTS